MVEIDQQGAGVSGGSASKFSLQTIVPVHGVTVGVGDGVGDGGGIVGVAGGVGSMGCTKIILLVPVRALLASVAVIVCPATM